MTAKLASIRLLLRDLLGRARAEGIGAVLKGFGERLRAGLGSEQRLIVLAKDLSDIRPAQATAEVRVEELTAGHLPALAELNRKRRFTRADLRFARYVEHGYNGYVGFCNDEIIGYYWWVDRTATPLHPDLANLGLGIELDEGDVYGCDYFVLEEFRGGGIAGEFLSKIEGDIANRGNHTIWGYVVSDNRPARWLYSLRGYKPMWTVLRRTVRFRAQSEPVPN